MHRIRRARAASRLLVCVWLLASIVLFAHQVEHIVSGETQTCLVCMAAPQHGAVDMSVPFMAHPPGPAQPPRYIADARTVAPAIHAYSSRAPPVTLSAV